MEAILKLKTSELDDEQLQTVTQKLCRTLKDVGEDINANLPKGEIKEGNRGAIEIGTIILSLIGGGGVITTLINVLNSYVQRSPGLNLKITKGKKSIELSVTNFQTDQLSKTIKDVSKVLED